MSLAGQWLRRPQNVWLRRAIFQIHLWTGIGTGLYIFAISVTGSALVFRNEMYKSFEARPRAVTVLERKLTKEELFAAAERAYPGYSVAYSWESKKPNQATEIWMSRGTAKKQRLFDPYTGKDLGESIPYMIQFLKWTADLHTDLLFGNPGRTVNGIGGFVLALLCATGIVIWWPGVKSWRRGLTIQWSANWKRLNWDLHSAVGFWTISIVFIFGITGAYLVFTAPFQRVIDYFAPLNVYKLPEDFSLALPVEGAQLVTVADEDAPPPRPRRRRPPPPYSFGDKIVRWSSWLHFGNFAGAKTKGLWVVLGLIPPFLFVTGTIMWWNRVLGREARRTRKRRDSGDTVGASIRDPGGAAS